MSSAGATAHKDLQEGSNQATTTTATSLFAAPGPTTYKSAAPITADWPEFAASSEQTPGTSISFAVHLRRRRLAGHLDPALHPQ